MKIVLSDADIRDIIKKSINAEFPGYEIKISLSCKDKSFSAIADLRNNDAKAKAEKKHSLTSVEDNEENKATLIINGTSIAGETIRRDA
jgi:hypothetical protein